MMQTVCGRCAAPLPGDAKFCPRCGAGVPGVAGQGDAAMPPAFPSGQYRTLRVGRDAPVAARRSFLQLMWQPWRRSFDFGGRSGRREYWAFATVALAVYVALFAFMLSLAQPGSAPGSADAAIVAIAFIGIVLWWLLTLVPGTALAVRRLHDINASGGLYIIFVFGYLLFAPFAWIGLIILGSIAGTRGGNLYGPDPNGSDVGEIFN